VFAGLRPLAAPTNHTDSTKEISRSHKLLVSPSGLVTITGGKWTTYRKMAEDTVDKAIKVGGLEKKLCVTAGLKIHGAADNHSDLGSLYMYGTDAKAIRELLAGTPELSQQLHEKFPHTYAEVVWAVRNEMARTVEDVLARRLRVLFLDAKVAAEMAPKAAAIMAKELDYSEEWQQQQLSAFTELANKYLLQPFHVATETFPNPKI
jgi:glycerol-3-phosphate dehydrogenase